MGSIVAVAGDCKLESLAAVAEMAAAVVVVFAVAVGAAVALGVAVAATSSPERPSRNCS